MIGGVIVIAIAESVLRAFTPLAQLCPRHVVPAEQWRGGIGGRRALHDPHQAIGVVVGERLEQYGIDDAEHRGGGADAKGQRDHRRSGEAGASRQATNRVPMHRWPDHQGTSWACYFYNIQPLF